MRCGVCVQASQQFCGDGQDVESLKHRGQLITLKGPQWSQRLQWSHWFSGRAQIDEPVGEQAIEDWLRAIAIRPTERLNEGVTRRLRLVSAPAGFGKTTLLNEWAFHFGLATE